MFWSVVQRMLAVVSATGHAAILVSMGAGDDVTVEVVNVKFPDVVDRDELFVEIAA